MILFVSLFLFTGTAFAECYIYISPGPTNSNCTDIPKADYVADSFQGSNINPRRCLNRAIEYHNYCGLSSKRYVNAYFVLDGVATVASSTTGNPNNTSIYATATDGRMIHLGQAKLIWAGH